MTALEDLIADCGSGDPDRQVAAALDLMAASAVEGAAAVRELLRSADPAVRATGARVLGAIASAQDSAAGDALTTALADPEPLVRAESADALGGLGFQPAAPTIRRLVANDPDPLVRASAAEAIGNLKDSVALPQLVRALDDLDESVRAYAAASLGLVGGEPALETVTRALRTEAHSVRVQAELLGAAYRLGDADALTRLMTVLERSDELSAEILLSIVGDLIARPERGHLSDEVTVRVEAALAQVADTYPRVAAHATALADRFRSR
jgi:HEAT repeat protein